MLRKIEIAVLLVLACCAFAMAAQKQSLKIVPDTAASGLKSGNAVVRVEWVELSGPGSPVAKETPTDARVYYARTPAGGDLSKYTPLRSASTENVVIPFNAVNKKRTEFIPNAQGGAMGPGAYYGIVAAVVDGDTVYSDYFNIMVESSRAPTLTSPKANIMGGGLVAKVDGLTPTFRWNGVPGVPYYHVILSDEAILQKTDSGYAMSGNISVIWQAITPNTQITYGAPDPSNTITATPPPLAPGKTYSWMVLNNYGNHLAYSSSVVDAMDLVLGSFEINGTPIGAPRVVSPIAADSFTVDGMPNVEFKWTDLDEGANSYLINLFSSAGSKDLGMGGGLESLSASLLVWEATVSRGGKGRGDTLSVVLDAAGTLTTGTYVWRVYAIDSRGAGSTGERSKSSFRYSANMGNVRLTTVEALGGVPSPVGFVELRTEALSGPTQAPLAFYTDNNGVVNYRPFPVGTYRITAVKEGYYNQTVTVSVQQGDTVSAQIFMSRPEATLYGKVTAASDGSAVNMARVAAVSEWGDTLSALTDAGGGFTLSCRAGDWSVYVEKAGYRSTSPRVVPLRLGDNRDYGTVSLQRNPFALSGVVRNGDGAPVMGAKVRLLTTEGVVVDELASTPQNGAYSFYLNSGTYILTAEKPGFVMFSRSVSVTGVRSQDITIREGATLVNGSIIGKNWVAGENRYVSAPITSAAVMFWEENSRDTFMVASDAVFGKFSVSLQRDKRYNVRFRAAGFDSAADAAIIADTGGATMTFTDTLYALAAIRGAVRDQGGGALGGVSVMVYDADNQVAASGRTSADGNYEVRNIPNGANFKVGAGLRGYYSTTPMFDIAGIRNGQPSPNRASYDFVMDVGDRSITWNVVGFEGSGSIKVISPLNAVIPFSGGTASLEQVGPGNYVIEAVAESDPTRLHLSYHAFELRDEPENIYFQLRHQRVDTLEKSGALSVDVIGEPHSGVKKLELFYRSEGSARYKSVSRDIVTGDEYKIGFTADMDASVLYYYFRVHLENGDIYGSGKQVFSAYVRPDVSEITRISVEPGAMGEDTLYMPSAYNARFAFAAFYSDRYMPLGGSVGTVSWSVRDESGAEVASSTGMVLAYTTPAGARTLTLEAKFTPSSSYRLRGGVPDAIRIPIRVTGAALSYIAVRRNGEEGPITSTQRASFSIEALDDSGRAVTVSPQWSVAPAAAGSIDPGSGAFQPRPDFFGTARISATVGGRRVEYAQEGAEFPGQAVNFVLRRRESGNDTANTRMGMRLVFAEKSVPSGESAEFSVSVPELKNYVHRGSEEFKMADSVAFDLSCPAYDRIEGEVSIIFDIPEHLRSAAGKNGQAFMVARWVVDSLKWIPIGNSEIINSGAAVSAKLYNGPSDAPAPAKGRGKKSARAGVNSAASEAVSKLAASARYALVTKSEKLSVSMSVSPHPFSPYIRPVREHGVDAPEGTCVKVNVDAPQASVRSIKVHVYNATGKRVWAVDKLNAETGENRFWWNGRTSGRGDGRSAVGEEVWDEGLNDRNRSKPMCRNGRYFVTVIVTDVGGEQKRLMKPVVLMK